MLARIVLLNLHSIPVVSLLLRLQRAVKRVCVCVCVCVCVRVCYLDGGGYEAGKWAADLKALLNGGDDAVDVAGRQRTCTASK